MKRDTHQFARFLGAGKVASITRATITFSGLFGFVQACDRFLGTDRILQGTDGLMVLIVGSISASLAIELAILREHYRKLTDTTPKNLAPTEVLAESILQYALSLETDGIPKDRAILELRNWGSRILHLLGANGERSQLGQIALTSAIEVGDLMMQATILIDDLGWTIHELGDDESAVENIKEALTILDQVKQDPEEQESDAIKDLELKANRHIINIEAPGKTITDIQSEFELLRKGANTFESGKLSTLHKAQIDHSHAKLLLDRIEDQVGKGGQVDSTGSTQQLLAQGIELAANAELGFQSLGDKERQIKALSVKTELLSHDHRKQRYSEAKRLLERRKKEVARNIL